MENNCLFCNRHLPPIEEGEPCQLKHRVCLSCWEMTDRTPYLQEKRISKTSLEQDIQVEQEYPYLEQSATEQNTRPGLRESYTPDNGQ